MIRISNTVDDLFIRMRAYFQGESALQQKYSGEEPLRSELFSTWQMQKHGVNVANTHSLSLGFASDKLLKRLDNNENVLLQVRDLLVDALKEQLPLTPASEWLLDNFYLIEEQISIGKKHLPKGYSQNLPHLSSGPSAGFPRVYDIALEIISHSDGRVDLVNLSSFIEAYQNVHNLTLGELWAIPIMLRLALIENLRRVSAHIAIDRIDQNIANYWAEQLMEIAEKKPKDLILVIADMARSNPVLSSSFVAEFNRRLQGKGAGLAMPLTWVEQQLSETGYTSAELVHIDNQSQAADQVSMRNSIESLRLLRTTEWRDFVESISAVDRKLNEDIDGVYGRMDFTTRDTYRHVIESIAKKSSLSETEIAGIAINLSRQSADKNEEYRRRHVGYYLIDKGIAQTQQAAKMRCTLWDKISATLMPHRFFIYAGTITFGSLLLCVMVGGFAYTHGVNHWLVALLFVLCFIGGSQLVMAVVNWVVTLLSKPRVLPKMDFSDAIPSEDATMVTVPCMITSMTIIEELAETLEVRYLANPHENVYFALLTDYRDAATETTPKDGILLKRAVECIENLNKKYQRPGGDIFFLFHRSRKWNPREKCWMGYERKRGKLGDLNALLQDEKHDAHAFEKIVGNYSKLPAIKYVICLDADTQLPRESAAKMIATMAHPLNHPLYSLTEQRVTEGYGILQPRVAVSLPKSNSSVFVRMHSSDSGLDPYTRVSSDVYQDLFSEGSFIGKGIYQVDTFEKALKDKFPENRILSHDLLEGCYTRSGLITDVLLYEDFPETYQADVSRRHRWIRGDWQIASWATPFVPEKSRKLGRNRLSALSRWKIADNIRRSLVPPALVLLFFMGWRMLPYPWLWTTGVVAVLVLPVVLTAFWHLIHKPKDLSVRPHLREFAVKAYDNFLQVLFYIACLPFEAYYNLDAIIRTNWRMIFSNRKLLQWVPSGSQRLKGSRTLVQTYVFMWAAPVVALITGIFIVTFTMNGLLVAAPILLLWLAAPAIAWKTGRPRAKKSAVLSADELSFLRSISRKTWYFFEKFVCAEENWLPPDNYQEHPKEAIAHRTSPTNIALSLLANLSAYDFGYISPGVLLSRTAETFKTMDKLERYHRHFYNWYDTLTLEPLAPKYVSTVDSGNLAGNLITLRQGLLELPAKNIIQEEIFRGLQDTLRVAQNEWGKDGQRKLSGVREQLNALCENPPVRLSEIYRELSALKDKVQDVINEEQEEGTIWLQKLAEQAASLLEDLCMLVPWAGATVPEKFAEFSVLDNNLNLYALRNCQATLSPQIGHYATLENTEEERLWLSGLKEQVVAAGQQAAARIKRIASLADECMYYADMDYDFLYDKSKHLLRIGYNVEEHIADNSYYDLLASEARLGLFVAISQGKLPQDAWFALGRLLTNAGKTPILLSWSGSMFEYLMPQLIMPTYENTLIDQTSTAMVNRQIDYGKKRGVPWGVSESGYNTVDASLNYQYRAFGVPGLGLKRGLGDDLVIAPYATMLALMIAPGPACDNLQLMAHRGFEGQYGFYEAIDYTSSRLPRGQSEALVRSFMVHHQGMGFLSLAYLLLDRKMQQRFEADPQFQSALLLLQERIPRATIFYSHTPDVTQTNMAVDDPQMRIIATPHTAVPEVQLLSNSHYHVVVTNAGGGYSRWRNLAVTRWREDSTLDNWGVFCYIKDMETGEYWSNTFQPTLKPARRYEAVFSQGHAEFRRRDNDFETRTEIVVSPEDDVEVRRVRITNRNNTKKVLEITSYAEVVLTPQPADEAHPAFSNLFVETEIRRNDAAIVCTRRPRSSDEQPPWMFHLMSVNGVDAEQVSFETDRMQFIGRGRTIAAPRSMEKNEVLSGSQGSVLDPVVAIRYRITLKPNQTATFDMVLGIADTKEVCEGLLYKYQDRHLKNRAFELSWTHSQVLLRQINATEAEAQLYGRIAGSIIYVNPALRAAPAVISSNFKGQSGLWSYAISGDLPIILLRVQNAENVELVKQLIKAHVYWRLKGVKADLVIWNEDFGSYRQELQDQIQSFIAVADSVSLNDQPGGIFVRSYDQISTEDRILLQTVARVIIDDNVGTLAEQINRKHITKLLPPALTTVAGKKETDEIKDLTLPDGLSFNNSFGGFTQDGREYITIVKPDQKTPAPWVNVIANSNFGTVISESGSAYTWAGNAHEYRLTPWQNDPVSDGCGEAFYLRDEDTGRYWSPTPLPCPGKATYMTRHGFGYSVFVHVEEGIHTELWIYVDVEKNTKFNVLKIKNLSGRARKLSVTGYVEWVLGDLVPKNAMHIITEKQEASGAVFAYNHYSSTYAGRVAYFDADGAQQSFTADRVEFLGRNGSLQNPEALSRSRLSGKSGAALDPCAAIQVAVSLFEEEEKEVVFRLGVGENKEEAQATVQEFKGGEAAGRALDRVHAYWNKTLGAVQVNTPDAALNILANGWLAYQTLACRIWGRSGYYQSGGAFGFRDQLQDVLALLHVRPEIARGQILLAASRQFKEGDVQHWWHPPLGRGVRTHCSDDYLWLPYVTARYVQVTGDKDILGQAVSFLEGRPLNPHEDSYYDLPVVTNHQETLYAHCVCAIRHGFRFGDHGLPLMGTGDWNDGMDKVGEQGKGESVWLGFFLYSVLRQFTAIAEAQSDPDFVRECTTMAEELRKNINQSAWDGNWYRRAYFDDGTPLGSAANEECRIDSIAQSWSVLSGAGEPARSETAMQSLDQNLVRREEGTILLLDPAFDKSALNPGYIKGYAPGVRENGGQYTHAAIWAMMAFAEQGKHELVWELFSMVNPIQHAVTAEAVRQYKVEPYVMAADVYNAPAHKGRGGWTWYTGSAGWMYQFVLDSLLGVRRTANKLCFAPCIPKDWPSFSISYWYEETYYHIEVFNGDKDAYIYLVDGVQQQENSITLVNDQTDHQVVVRTAN